MLASDAKTYQAMREFIGTVALFDSGSEDEAASFRAMLRTALQEELSPVQKKYLELYYMQRNTMCDVAEQCGVNTSTVSRTLKRARTQLKRVLRYGGRALLAESLDDITRDSLGRIQKGQKNDT